MPSKTAEPRYATPRRNRPTRGDHVAKLADVWGRPLMPWQRQVVDVALEYDAKTGRPCYREVWVTVPRQSGKTLAMAMLMMERAVGRDVHQRIAYTAQTGWDARKKLIDDLAPEIKASPLSATMHRVLRGAGSEAIEFVNGSRIEVVPTTEAAGHGKTLDLGVIDEAFHDQDYRREQSMIPAMATKPGAQLLGISTAGTDKSVLLSRKVDKGRAAVNDDVDSGICYFEWSADPGQISDPGDHKLWRRVMPALGHTIDESVVQHAFESMDEDEFLRAFLNVPTVGNVREIPPNLWEAVNDDHTEPAGQLALAVECTKQRDAASIAVADLDGALELVDHRSGTGWVVDRTAELADRLDAPVFIDKGGPAGVFVDQLEARGVPVVTLGTSEFTQACGAFYDAIVERTIRVRSHGATDLAVAAATKRQVGETWAWSRKVGAHDATPMVAMCVALWGTQHMPESAEVEMFVGFA